MRRGLISNGPIRLQTEHDQGTAAIAVVFGAGVQELRTLQKPANYLGSELVTTI